MSTTPPRNWDERYNTDDFFFGTNPNDFLVSAARQMSPASRTLCLADGEGRNGVYLASLGHHVTSIDLSAVGVQKTQLLARQKDVPISTLVADLADHDLGIEQWDCIVSIFFHIPPQLRARIYPRIVAALAPGGLLILESYTPDQLKFGTGGPPVAENMLTLALLGQAFPTLTFIHAQELEREVIEGTGHTGHAAVVQLIAQKSSKRVRDSD